jgi:hypothetical protein
LLPLFSRDTSYLEHLDIRILWSSEINGGKSSPLFGGVRDGLAERQTLLRDAKTVRSPPPRITDSQRQTLDLPGVPAAAFLG